MVRCPSGVGYSAVKPGKTSSQEWDVTALEYKYYKLMSPCKLPLSFSICARKEIWCCKSQQISGQSVKTKFPLAFLTALALEINSHLCLEQKWCCKLWALTMTGKCLLKLLSFCNLHKAVIREILWVFKKPVANDSLKLLYFMPEVVRVRIHSHVATGQLFHLMYVLLHPEQTWCWYLLLCAGLSLDLSCSGFSNLLWKWKKTPGSVMNRLELISSLQNIRSWLHLLIGSCLLLYLLHLLYKVIHWFMWTGEWGT